MVKLSTTSWYGFLILLVVLILGAFSAAQHQAYTEDGVLRYAKSIDVAKLDPTLPSRPLEEWLLRGPARIDEVHWRISPDCDLKNPEPDAEGESPLCVKIGFRRGDVTGFGVLRVGTLKSGIKGRPAFLYLDVLMPCSIGNYEKLSEFPRFLDGITPSACRGRESDHPRLSTPIVKAWHEIPVGSPVYALDDAAESKNWLERALIQLITSQTGRWHICIEHGYSVFRIYPYLSDHDPQPRIYQGIVLKVKGTLSVEDLVAAIRKRTPTVRIDEYDIFGADNVSVQRYSRPHSSAP